MSSEHHPHPTPAQYWKIAALLAILTAIEVAVFYINEATHLYGLDTFILLGLSTLKFVIVVGWYMHLRYEKTVLNRFFTAGFVLAVSLYTIVLFALGAVALFGN